MSSKQILKAYNVVYIDMQPLAATLLKIIKINWSFSFNRQRCTGFTYIKLKKT